jgi:hypothetical protein
MKPTADLSAVIDHLRKEYPKMNKVIHAHLENSAKQSAYINYWPDHADRSSPELIAFNNFFLEQNVKNVLLDTSW